MTRASAIGFFLVTSALGGYYGRPFFLESSDKSIHLPGETTHGHYQIEMACNACHTPYGGVDNEACNKCHGSALEEANNSHTEAMFNDPRNAERSTALDAKNCITCHREHVPERTRAMGVTVPVDFCVKCHEDVLEDRPTHKGLAFTTCQDSGCHNFHDNRGIYEDFLIKHLKEPDLLAVAKVALRGAVVSPDKGAKTAPDADAGAAANTDADAGAEADADAGAEAAADAGAAADADAGAAADAGAEADAGALKESPRILTAKDQDAPSDLRADPKLVAEWEASAHARANVNCTGCHMVKDPAGASKWQDKIDHAVCAECHQNEDKGFLAGRHGMRIAQGLSPMTPAMARQPMKSEAKSAGHELGCASCHSSHGFDTVRAAVDSCLGCHDDKHSQAYKASRHYKLWQAEQSGAAEKGTGVSCATCHLPREASNEGGNSRVVVQHNQNSNLRPNDKMIRSVCMSCHGLGFSIDSLADADLVQRNFNGRPGRHIESVDMAERRNEDKGKKGE